MSFRENTVKIVATLGPASSSKEMLRKLIDTGVDVFRLNFSHGTHEEKRELLNRIREVDPYIGILADIQGPKIRVGMFKDPPYNLSIGQEVKVFEKDIEGDDQQFSVPLPGFLKSMKKGEIFFINDGIIKVQVEKVLKDHVIGKVLAGGPISNRKGVNIPKGELQQKEENTRELWKF